MLNYFQLAMLIMIKTLMLRRILLSYTLLSLQYPMLYCPILPHPTLPYPMLSHLILSFSILWAVGNGRCDNMLLPTSHEKTQIVDHLAEHPHKMKKIVAAGMVDGRLRYESVLIMDRGDSTLFDSTLSSILQCCLSTITIYCSVYLQPL